MESNAHDGGYTSDAPTELHGATRAHSQATVEVGTVIGRFRVTSFLGQGAFGVVYAGIEDGPLARAVAIKVVGATRGGLALLAALAEARALGRLRHACIAHCIDAGSLSDGRAYLVMEHIDGLAVNRFCEEQRSPLTTRLRLMCEVLDGIEVAHRAGVIHRDIKCSNVLIHRRGKHDGAIIIDFGVAAVTDALQEHDAEDASLTSMHHATGTLEAMAPEQLVLYALPDVRSDLYSIGVMLHTLVCGRPPFKRKSPSPDALADFVQQVRLSAPPSLGASFVAAAARFATTGINVGLLNSVLGKALEKSPDARYQTAGEFRADLLALLDGHVPAAAVKTRFDRMRRMVRMNRVACAAAFIAFLALSSAAVFEGYSASAQRVAQEATQAANDAQAVSIAQQEATIKVFHGILNAVVTDLRALGNAKELSKYWPKIIEGYASAFGTDDPRVNSQRLFYGEFLVKEERFDDALDVLKVLEARALAALGPTHRSTIRIRRCMAQAYQGKHDYPVTIALLEQLEEDVKQSADPCDTSAHAWSITGMLGQTFSELNRHEEAIASLRRAIEMQRGCFGREGPALLNDMQAMSMLADALKRAEHYDEALALYDEVIARADTITTRSPLAVRAWRARAAMYATLTRLEQSTDNAVRQQHAIALRGVAHEWQTLTSAPQSAFDPIERALRAAGVEPLAAQAATTAKE